MRRLGVRGWAWLASATVVIAALAMGSAFAAPSPDQVGEWTTPFEEGGSSTPRCVTGPDGRILCKPTAVGQAALHNGRVLYMNGVESNDNLWYNYPTEISPESRNSLSRVLDLLDGTPGWTVPSPEDAGASNPNIDPGSNGLDDPFGVAGVPGNPGDGLAGSMWGTLGLPPQNATSPPDDIQDNDGDLFCTDMSMLADGRILIAGGSDWYNEPAVTDRDSGGPYDVGFIEIEGLRSARIFDPATETYTQVGDMTHGRWYPSLVTMPDGKIMAISGVTKLIKSTQGSQVVRNETFDPATGEWTENYTGMASEASLPLYPRVYLMPNGKIFYTGAGQTFGPAGQAADELLWGLHRFFDPATNEWEVVGPAMLGTRGGATMVPLAMDPPHDTAKLLVYGGTLFPTPGSLLALPLSTITTIGADGSVVEELTGNLNNRRWFSSGVALPDGTVLAFSGADRDEVIPWSGTELPVRKAELFDPTTGTWTELASAGRDRTYHNSAMLLPDGRVLVGGHAPIGSLYGANHDFIPGVTANNDRDSSFEVFSPPYLFRGGRPILDGVQRGIAWGSSFTITAPEAAEITQVVLSRLPSPQHTVDTDARTLRLAFSKGEDTVTATAPPQLAAPPGYYYLFILNGDGVPSVARIVKVGGPEAHDAAPTIPIYSSGDPAAPSGSATPDEDSSYINKPPPLPMGMVAGGLVAIGVGVPAKVRRRRWEIEL